MIFKVPPCKLKFPVPENAPEAPVVAVTFKATAEPAVKKDKRQVSHPKF